MYVSTACTMNTCFIIQYSTHTRNCKHTHMQTTPNLLRQDSGRTTAATSMRNQPHYSPLLISIAYKRINETLVHFQTIDPSHCSSSSGLPFTNSTSFTSNMHADKVRFAQQQVSTAWCPFYAFHDVGCTGMHTPSHTSHSRTGVAAIIEGPSPNSTPVSVHPNNEPIFLPSPQCTISPLAFQYSLDNADTNSGLVF